LSEDVTRRPSGVSAGGRHQDVAGGDLGRVLTAVLVRLGERPPVGPASGV
jgi:hypothetical protein